MRCVCVGWQCTTSRHNHKTTDVTRSHIDTRARVNQFIKNHTARWYQQRSIFIRTYRQWRKRTSENWSLANHFLRSNWLSLEKWKLMFAHLFDEQQSRKDKTKDGTKQQVISLLDKGQCDGNTNVRLSYAVSVDKHTSINLSSLYTNKTWRTYRRRLLLSTIIVIDMGKIRRVQVANERYSVLFSILIFEYIYR